MTLTLAHPTKDKVVKKIEINKTMYNIGDVQWEQRQEGGVCSLYQTQF